MHVTPAKALAQLLATDKFQPDDIYISTNKIGNLTIERLHAETQYYLFMGWIDLRKEGPALYWLEDKDK